MDKIVIFLLCFYVCFAKITIKNLEVPASVSVDEDEVILDCDFDSQGEVVDEVRWFRNYDYLVYQWLPLANAKPDVTKNFIDNIDITYKASDDNKTMYRAMRIVALSPDLSGNYSCKVSGPNSEDIKTKTMIVYDPADSDLDLDIMENYSVSNSTEDDLVAIFCHAQGLQPKPDLTISVFNDNETEIKYRMEIEHFYIDDNNTVYNISTIAIYDSDNLPKSFDYTCELTIPGTAYELNETRRYTLESDNDTRIETEEEFSNLLNSANFTEVFEEPQEIETQIEEIIQKTTTAEPANHKDDDDTVKKEDIKENASIRQSPSFNLLSTVLTIVALGPLFYL